MMGLIHSGMLRQEVSSGCQLSPVCIRFWCSPDPWHYTVVDGSFDQYGCALSSAVAVVKVNYISIHGKPLIFS